MIFQREDRQLWDVSYVQHAEGCVILAVQMARSITQGVQLPKLNTRNAYEWGW